MCILELSKVLMYEFHYDYIKNKYDSKSKLLFTVTDSLIYEIKTEDVYEDFSSNKEMFDFSNYLTKSKYYDNSNKIVIGKMKDETNKEFVGLRTKMYSFLVKNNEYNKAKDVNKNVLQQYVIMNINIWLLELIIKNSYLNNYSEKLSSKLF